MTQVHLAPMGYVYDGSLNLQLQPNAVGGFVKPERTFCGLAVLPDRAPVKVVLPHDHERACRPCLEALAGKPQLTPDQVQPLMFAST